jgi:rod shape determining protein RodA
MSATTSQTPPLSLSPQWLKDFWFLLPAVGATGIGIYLLSGAERDYLRGILPWQKQSLWCLFGVMVALAVSRIPPKPLVLLAPLFYALNLALLVLVLAVGTEKGGAKSWFDLGPIAYQPAETMKLVTILALARLLYYKQTERVGLGRVLVATALAAVPAFLIVVQPDLGSAMIFPAILFACLYGARVPRRYLVLLISPIWALIVLPGDPLLWLAWISGVGLALLFLRMRGEKAWRLCLFFLAQIAFVVAALYGIEPAWEHGLEPHQKDRLVGFLQREETDARKMSPATYHLHQSLIAISSGGLFGQGRGQGLQSAHGFIPMMRTDFIFAVVAEELGFVGCLLLFACLLGILFNSLNCVAAARTWEQSGIVFGILGVWGAHILVNIGMTMGLCPITGIPLPFVSYGGTALLSNYLGLGMILAVYRRRATSDLPTL